ncbi:MAG: hypothetical protein II771_03300 [Clostridia bacterium]|nr:hypothetical protein [Clostridia bacterium]
MCYTDYKKRTSEADATDAALCLHGKNGSPAEAGRFRPLFPACDVTGIDYRGETPWDAGPGIREAFPNVYRPGCFERYALRLLREGPAQ